MKTKNTMVIDQKDIDKPELAPVVVKETPIGEIRAMFSVNTETNVVTLKDQYRNKVNATDFVRFISDIALTANEQIGAIKNSATTRACFSLYEAGKINETFEEEVIEKLTTTLGKTATANLVSLASNIPLMIANGFKTPLTVFKDIVQALKMNPDKKESPIPVDAKGKIVPAKLKAAMREALPLLVAGTVTQAKAREIVKACKSAPAKSSTPVIPVGKGANDLDVIVQAFVNNADRVCEKRSEFDASQMKLVHNALAKVARVCGWTLTETK